VFGPVQPGDNSDDEGSEVESSASGSHETGTGDNATRKRTSTKRVIAIAVVAAAVAISGTAYALTQHSGTSSEASASTLKAASKPKTPLLVRWTSPATNATGVNGADPIIVTFSGPVAAKSPYPQLTPSVPGTWSTSDNSMIFTPSQPFGPSEQVKVQIPAGVRSASGNLLEASVTDKFTTGAYSQAALAQILVKLDYLPMTWSPEDPSMKAAAEDTGDAASQTPQGQAFDPPLGTFNWEAGYPSSLIGLWSPDQANVLLRGAVMAFESEHNMTIDGSLTPRLWRALFQAEASGDQNKNGYTYAVANKGSPETLTIWHNGQVVLHSLANTGIPVAPTVDGTFPVYLRFLNTIMSGTNPDGSHYSDPVSFVSYFNGGDAVHYFPRGGYGYEQSLGCVELPYGAAEQAYPYLTYGSLVTVQG
jgi:Bacterial Ig-like domain/L,D-transpeptidase catalytic domain